MDPEAVRAARLSELRQNLSSSQFVAGAVKDDYLHRQTPDSRSHRPRIKEFLDTVKSGEQDQGEDGAAAAAAAAAAGATASTKSKHKSWFPSFLRKSSRGLNKAQ